MPRSESECRFLGFRDWTASYSFALTRFIVSRSLNIILILALFAQLLDRKILSHLQGFRQFFRLFAAGLGHGGLAAAPAAHDLGYLPHQLPCVQPFFY